MTPAAVLKSGPEVQSVDPVLRKVLHQWCSNIDRLAEDWCAVPDLPWLYRERALLSVLAGAVWVLGGTAFEEYASEKRSRDDRRSKSRGREDMYFALGERDFKAEAKHVWAPATRCTEKSIRMVQEKLYGALNDVRNCAADGQERLGLLFAAPYVRKSRRGALDDLLADWKEKVFWDIECDARAATFPEAVRHSCGPWGGDPYVYPGVAVFVTKVP